MRIRRIGLAAITTVAALAGFVGPGAAQEKVWKHGLINAKADAGIFLMVSTPHTIRWSIARVIAT